MRGDNQCETLVFMSLPVQGRAASIFFFGNLRIGSQDDEKGVEEREQTGHVVQLQIFT